MKRKKSYFYINPMGSEMWVRTLAGTVRELQRFHGEENVEIDRREDDSAIHFFISVKYS